MTSSRPQAGHLLKPAITMILRPPTQLDPLLQALNPYSKSNIPTCFYWLFARFYSSATPSCYPHSRAALFSLYQLRSCDHTNYGVRSFSKELQAPNCLGGEKATHPHVVQVLFFSKSSYFSPKPRNPSPCRSKSENSSQSPRAIRS